MTDEKSSKPADVAVKPAYLEFVSSHYVLAEKQGVFRAFLTGVKGYDSPLDRLSLLVFVASTLLIASLCLFTSYMHANYPMSALEPLNIGIALVVAMCYSTFVTMLFSFLVGKVSEGFPTNIRLDQDKIWFAWCLSETKQSVSVPWPAVLKVDIEAYDRPGVKDKLLEVTDPWKGKRLLIEIDRSFFSRLDGWKFLAQMQSLWRGGKPFACKYGKTDRSIIQLAFPLDALTLDSDREKLVEAVKEHVSEDCLTEQFLEMEGLKSAPGITRLWLDEMNSFRRTRDNELEPGAILASGRYQVVSRLATGGQAKIYNAVTPAGENVALKELVLPVHAGLEVRERSFANVKREAKLLASFSHPAIVKIIDSFVEDHRAYLVLEKIEGLTLRRLVKENGAIAPAVVCDYARQICEILIYLHELTPPVVHRDLAPDNLMLSAGAIKLIDFNVAQQLESSSTRTVVGKHNYMAPEQFRGQPCEQSDLYSMGATLAFLLTGEEPTPLSQQKCEQDGADSVLSELSPIIEKLTCLELEGRFKTAREVQSALLALNKSSV